MQYKTVGDFWDESYDKEIHHEKRLLKVLDVLDTIGKMTVYDCREMYAQMQDILEYNYNLIDQKLFDKILNL